MGHCYALNDSRSLALVSYLLARMMGRSSVVFLSPDVGMFPWFYSCRVFSYRCHDPLLLAFAWLYQLTSAYPFPFIKNFKCWVVPQFYCFAWVRGRFLCPLSHAVRLLSLVMFIKFWLSSVLLAVDMIMIFMRLFSWSVICPQLVDKLSWYLLALDMIMSDYERFVICFNSPFHS